MASPQMKPQFKLILIAVCVGVALFGLKATANHFGFGILKSITVGKATLPDIKDAVVGDVQPTAYPSTSANGCGDPIRSEICSGRRPWSRPSPD